MQDSIQTAEDLLKSLPKMDDWVIYWIDESKDYGFTVGDLKNLIREIKSGK